MITELVPLTFKKIMQSKSYSCIVMEANEKKFGIYTDLASGKAMQRYLTETRTERPLTHDLISMVFRGLDIRIKQIVVVDVEDTLYFARIFLEQMQPDLLHIVEIDARPSDCITLALIHKAPIYCTPEVLEKAVELIEEG